MTQRPIFLISGTNRPNSSTMKVALAAEAHYKRLGVPVDLYSLIDLPAEIFAPISYTAKPESFIGIQNRVVNSAGLHVVTPEYNGSFPGVLKYFIDMLKFPESFEAKPVAFTGVAAGLWGALRPVEQLQMVFSYRNAYIYPDRVFIPHVATKLSPEGLLSDASIDARLGKQVEGFAKFAHLLGPNGK